MVSGRAICIGGTLTWVDAFFFPASLSLWTIGINQTLVRLAMVVGIPLMVLWTDASGKMVANLAKSIGATLFKETWILTLATNACFLFRTFMITLATGYKEKERSRIIWSSQAIHVDLLTLHTVCVGISFISKSAGAHSPMILDLTLCIESTCH